jgi:hypothetical protein
VGAQVPIGNLQHAPAQVLDELEAFEVQYEAGGCRTDLDAPLRLLVAATRLTLKLVALGQHLSLAADRQQHNTHS